MMLTLTVITTTILLLVIYKLYSQRETCPTCQKTISPAVNECPNCRN